MATKAANQDQDPSEKVTPKQERFCQELVYGNYTQKEAATRAGYSEKSAAVSASRMLTKANILARVHELQAERLRSCALDPNWVLLQLKKTVDRSLQTEPVLEFNYDTKQMEPTGEYTFDSRGANEALKLIGSNMGMFQTKINLSGEVQVDDARARLAEKLAQRNATRTDQ